MMLPNYFSYFIACYGICFGFMFKATIFHNKNDFFDSMFKCSYCTGFWSGLFAWMFLFAPFTNISSENIIWVALSVVGHMFASSAFCYVADTSVQRLEELKNILSAKQEYEEDEEDEEEINPLERLRSQAIKRVERFENNEEESEAGISMSPLERLRAQAIKKVEDNG